jgi:signal transduction histidine kinase
VAVPIERYPGRVIGVLIVTIDLRRISDLILTSQGAKYGDPILIDRHANVLVHLDQSKLGSRWNVEGIIRRLGKGEVGTTKYHDSKGQYLLAAYQPLSAYGWGLIVQIPPDQTIYIIRNKVILLLGLMMAVIFIITGLLTYMAAGKIVTPIKKLTTATRQFGQGRQVAYVPADGDDEIAQLACAFYEMELRLTDFEKQRAQYISMIAHDLRNPLISISALFQSLQNNEFNEKDKASQVKSLKLKLEQVNRMLGDLLEFSRLDLGQITFNSEMISVRYLCQDIIAGYIGSNEKFKLKDFPVEFCVWADPIRLQQIIQNILDNSLKYTSADDLVTIDCQVNQDVVQILIADTGKGIPEIILANLFKPFQTTDLLKNSYGLGLAIAKRLAVGMGGDLMVESVPNKGTTFKIILPVVVP